MEWQLINNCIGYSQKLYFVRQRYGAIYNDNITIISEICIRKNLIGGLIYSKILVSI